MADVQDVQQPAVPSPDQQADAATAGPQAAPTAAPEQSQPSSVPQQTPVTAPTSAPASPTQLSPADKTKHVLGEIFQTIAGGKQKVWEQGPNGPVATYKDLAPGQIARGILAAAITGLAGGYDPANRGKGPAMSSAFSAGFKGEEEQREKQAGEQKEEAQKTFANQNASDELLMKKQRFAQEQQQSILDMQKTHQIMNQAAEKARQEGIVFTQEQQTFLQNQDNKFYASKIAGGKEIQDPKNPGQDLVLHTQEEANRYIADHKDQLLAPGDFDTRPFQRPGTGGWVILKTPLSVDEKREVRFVKTDKNGKPEQDKDGNYIPSGEKDQSGHVIPPTVLSGAEYRNKMKEVIDYKEASAKWQDSLAQSEERRAIAAKDLGVVNANKQLNDAGNEPNAIDTKTGLPRMGFKNKQVLRAFDLEGQRAAEANITKMNAAVANMVPDSQEAKDLRAAIDKTQNQADEYKARIAALSVNTPLPVAMTKSLLDENEGNATAALKFFDKQDADGKYRGSMQSDQITSTRASLLAAVQNQKQQEAQPKKQAQAQDEFGPSAAVDVLSNPAKLTEAQATIQQHLQSGTSFSDVQAGVKSAPNLSRADKVKLLNYLASSTPYNVQLKDGSSVNVGPDQMDSFLKSNPGATVVGDQGRYQQQQSQQQKEKQQDQNTQRETDINSQS